MVMWNKADVNNNGILKGGDATADRLLGRDQKERQEV
jgi:hypothetical protein